MKVSCPAKLNIGLKINSKRPDGYHDLETEFRLISLYDYLEIKESKNFQLNINNDEKFMLSELIREKIIRKLGDELPHDTFVQIDFIKEKKDITEIHATIYVNRKSQKQIVIGSAGETLKTIGMQSREEMEKYLNKKVFLKTWVKVKKNWNTDSGFIQSLGVGNDHESK